MVIYLDGAGLDVMARYANNPLIEGFTTNPSLMRKAGITSYRAFAKSVLSIAGEKPVSFEVLADDWAAMERQAYEIAGWGENVWVKIPITNTKGESSIDLIDRLQDLRLNITAVMTMDQLKALREVDRSHHIISVFCGRINDAGRSVPYVGAMKFRAKTLWASTRELYNLSQAEDLGYDIITMTPDLIAKLPLRGKDLKEYSLETVKQFHEDGKGIDW